MELEEQKTNILNIKDEQNDTSKESIFESNQLYDYYDNDNDNTDSNNKKEIEPSSNSQQLEPTNIQINQVSIRKKDRLKKVDFSYIKIPAQNILINQEFFYTHGDIVIDFRKKHTCLDDRYSPWNICKIWPVTQINKDAGIFTVNLENRFRPDFTYTMNQIQKYKQYPDQQIYDLMQNIEKFAGISKFLNQFLEQYFNVIKQNPSMLNSFYQRRSLFDKYMDPIYKQLNEQGAIFFASHSGPDIETNDFLFHKVAFSESLSHILGKTLEQLQDMYRRVGAYDFFDFEAQIEIYQTLMREQIHIFEQYQVGNYQINKDKIPFPKQFKMMTYDDIIFYTDVKMQMYKMSEFTNDTTHSIDFYAGVLLFEISPSTLIQIISIRQQNNEKKFQALTNESTKSIYDENLEYTLQAEIFMEKFIETQKQNQNQNLNKVCNYKMK